MAGAFAGAQQTFVERASGGFENRFLACLSPRLAFGRGGDFVEKFLQATFIEFAQGLVPFFRARVFDAVLEESERLVALGGLRDRRKNILKENIEIARRAKNIRQPLGAAAQAFDNGGAKRIAEREQRRVQPAQTHAQLMHAFDFACSHGGDVGGDLRETFEHRDTETIFRCHVRVQANGTGFDGLGRPQRVAVALMRGAQDFDVAVHGGMASKKEVGFLSRRAPPAALSRVDLPA